MTPATLKANAGIYLLEWVADRVAIRIDRVRDHSDQLSGEVCVKTLLPGADCHLHQARLNLTSTSARRTLAKHLEERLPGVVDWDAIIEEACVQTLETYRRGEPAVEIHDFPKREGPRYRLSPLLLDSLPNHMYGDGGVGKSLLAAYMAVLVSSGAQVDRLITVPGPVLYLDYEASGDELRERIELIEAGLGDPCCSNVQYRFCVQPLAHDIEEIQQIVAEGGIEFIIVDSMGAALGGEKGDPREPVIEYYRALRSLRICSLTIDHIAAGDSKDKKQYGSVYKRNLARQQWEVRKQQEPGESEATIGLYHRKTNCGGLLRPMGFRLTFAEGAIRFAPADVRAHSELAEGMGARQRILDYLVREGPATVKEVAEALDLTQTVVRVRLNDGRGKCFIQCQGEGKEPRWAATTDQEAY